MNPFRHAGTTRRTYESIHRKACPYTGQNTQKVDIHP